MLLKSFRKPVTLEARPRMLKKYRVLSHLAKGGMADVFLATAAGLGGFERTLVVKRILPELAHDTEYIRMFLDEARTAATLQHTNIVQVYDVDMVDSNVFYVMEHLHGQDVATVLRQCRKLGVRVPLAHGIMIGIAVAAGLHYAHEQWGPDGTPLEIVHRDVAPNNVVVTYDGNVKLIDFGIAKTANNLSSTRCGLFKGKLPYASPEQCRCEPVDRRSDVYSLAVMLYELTTGFQLFKAPSEYELVQLMMDAVVPRPSLRDASFPAQLETILLKALARDRTERYATARDLQLALEEFARISNLDMSTFSLGRWMESLFGEQRPETRAADLGDDPIVATAVTTPTGKWSLEAAHTQEACIPAATPVPAAIVSTARRPRRGMTIAAAAVFCMAAGFGGLLATSSATAGSPIAISSPQARTSAGSPLPLSPAKVTIRHTDATVAASPPTRRAGRRVGSVPRTNPRIQPAARDSVVAGTVAPAPPVAERTSTYDLDCIVPRSPTPP
jgi:serine/threonine protein kinase